MHRHARGAPAAGRAGVPVLPRAPKLRGKALGEALTLSAAKPATGKSIEALLARYAVAHDSARTRLESGMRVARLARLFAAPRLSPDGGVTDTRMSLAGVANFIRIFRQQQSAIESAYQDSVTRFTRQYGWSPQDVKQWYARPDQTEDPALRLVSASLLVGIDSILGVLDAQAGAYKIRGSDCLRGSDGGQDLWRAPAPDQGADRFRRCRRRRYLRRTCGPAAASDRNDDVTPGDVRKPFPRLR